MKRRNIRKRISITENSAAANEDIEISNPIAIQKDSKKSAEKEIKNFKLLSFEAEEKPLKHITSTKQDHKFIKRKEPTEKLNKNAITISKALNLNSAGEYTAEKLEILKSQTPSIPSGYGVLVNSQEEKKDEPIIKLSGSFKPSCSSIQTNEESFDSSLNILRVSRSKKKITANKKLTDLGLSQESVVGSEGNVENQRKAELKDDSLIAKEKIETINLTSIEEDDIIDFKIPGKETIRLARAKRERLRQARLAPDYLPLGGTSRVLSKEFKIKERKVNSISDDEDDDQEESTRIKLIGEIKNIKQIQENEEEEEEVNFICSENEGDDDEDAFVEAQMKKGMGCAGLSDYSLKANDISSIQQSEASMWNTELPVVSRETINNMAEEVFKNININIKQMEEAKYQTGRALGQMKQMLSDSLDEINNHERELADADIRYKKIQELKEYIEDLCDCLKIKSVIVDELENHLNTILRDHSSDFISEQKSVEAEEIEIAEAAAAAAIEILSCGGSVGMAALKADQAVIAIEKSLLDSEKISLDKSENSVKRSRATKRAERLNEAMLKSREYDYDIEKDLDESNPLNDLNFQEQLKELKEAAVTVFKDASEEFSDLEFVLKVFEKWKCDLYQNYISVYLPDSLPALLSCFIRLQMIDWLPLHGSCISSENFKWYTSLDNYGRCLKDSINKEDPDADLIPKIIRKIVLPIASFHISSVWIPGNYRQSLATAEILRELLVYVPVSVTELQSLIKTVNEKLSESTENFNIPSWPQPVIKASRIMESVLAVRFRKGLHLIASICCFSDILQKSFLEDLVLGQLIGKKLFLYMKSAVTDSSTLSCQLSKIYKIIPKDWFKAGAGARYGPLKEITVAVGRAMHEQKQKIFKKDGQPSSKMVISFVQCLNLIGEKDLAISLQQSFA